MKVGNGGNVGLDGEYSRKLFVPLFYSWCNGPLMYYSYCKSLMYSGSNTIAIIAL